MKNTKTKMRSNFFLIFVVLVGSWLASTEGSPHSSDKTGFWANVGDILETAIIGYGSSGRYMPPHGGMWVGSSHKNGGNTTRNSVSTDGKSTIKPGRAFGHLVNLETIAIARNPLAIELGKNFWPLSSNSPKNQVVTKSQGGQESKSTSEQPTQQRLRLKLCIEDSELVLLDINNYNEPLAPGCEPILTDRGMLHLKLQSVSEVDEHSYRLKEQVAKSAGLFGMRFTGVKAIEIIRAFVNRLPSYYNRLVIEGGSITKLEIYSLIHNSVTELSIARNKINAMEPGSIQMAKLKKIDIGNNKLDSTASLTALPPTIEELNLEKNKITTIPANSLSHLIKLRVLDLHGNPITAFDNNAFAGLDNLVSLSLKLTMTTDIKLDFLRTLKIKYLNLSYNKMKLTDSLKAVTPTVEQLDLSFNDFTKITVGSLSHLINLEEVNFDVNQISSIEPGAFRGLDRLKELSLAANAISAIEPNTLKTLKIKALNLESNSIKHTGSLKELPSTLETLNLAGNSIEVLPARDFSSVTKLKILFLNGNMIKHITKNAFDGLSELVLLDLSFNKLGVLENGIFNRLTNLDELRLRENDLVRVHTRGIVLPKLRIIDLVGNKIITVD